MYSHNIRVHARADDISRLMLLRLMPWLMGPNVGCAAASTSIATICVRLFEKLSPLVFDCAVLTQIERYRFGLCYFWATGCIAATARLASLIARSQCPAGVCTLRSALHCKKSAQRCLSLLVIKGISYIFTFTTVQSMDMLCL